MSKMILYAYGSFAVTCMLTVRSTLLSTAVLSICLHIMWLLTRNLFKALLAAPYNT